ncbi:hypothetical protein QQS21_002018 [Conoideocrella luteorostrata]|uniref:Uncharacterized protein n=1 Tax=Conoideocrella luteorostrata TaxID=1105319 RepID=A0AAJ0CVT3_9HYPO|nr:hypothetical protein QQS21_002018 [Conoideocrella luteorostrata]
MATVSSDGAAAVAADDDVYPTGRIDNAMVLKTMVLSVTMRFDAVLEPSKLHAALCTLLDTGDWRRLGGRLRRPARDETPQVLKIHVPRLHTASHPPVAYSYADFSGVSIAEHELGRHLPGVNGRDAALYAAAEDFREFAAARDLPDTIDGFLVPGEDRPVLSLRITGFADATLVAVAVPHILMDAMALGELMGAWSLALAGRMDEVPPVLGAREDVAYDAADAELASAQGGEKEPWALQPVYLAGFSFVLFVVRFLWAILTEPAMESRVLYLPKGTLDRMRAGAIDDIAAQAPRDDDNAADTAKPWISEGDVLFAWACRVVSLAQGTKPRPINAHNALNLRNRLPQTTPPPPPPTDGDKQPAAGVFVRNLVALSYLPVSPAEARGPVGLVAAKYRAVLATQASPTQVLWMLRALRACVDAGKDANIVCGAPPTGELLTMTNWIKADFARAVDFSPAVVVDGVAAAGERGRLGRIVYLHSQLHARSSTVRNTLGAVGKDVHGNMWLGGYFPPRTWDVVQKELDKMNQ